MSIHGTNSHPYLNTPSNGSEEDFEFRMWLEEKQKVLPTELLSGLNSAVGTMARATIQQVDAQQTACITPNPVPSAREIMEQMQRDMQTKYGPPKTTTTLDRQVGGDHYKKMPIQPWELIDAMYPGEKGEAFYMGTAIAYFMRWKEKGGLQDIEKGIHTLEHFLENMRKPA